MWIFYTHGIRGDFDLLPRLFTFLQQLRTRLSLSAPVERGAGGEVLLLDLGDSCAPEVWHCAATQGRSTLIVLDAMGYHAARADLSAESRARLGDMLHLRVIDAAHPAEINGTRIVSDAVESAAALTIALTPHDTTTLENGLLRLTAIPAAHVGAVRVSEATIRDQALYALPADTPPTPTIAGMVDFVLSEARQYQRRHDG